MFRVPLTPLLPSWVRLSNVCHAAFGNLAPNLAPVYSLGTPGMFQVQAALPELVWFQWHPSPNPRPSIWFPTPCLSAAVPQNTAQGFVVLSQHTISLFTNFSALMRHFSFFSSGTQWALQHLFNNAAVTATDAVSTHLWLIWGVKWSRCC